MFRPLALITKIMLVFSCAVYAQRENTLYAGLGSSGYQIGFQNQFSKKFSIGASANYLFAKPTVYTTLAGEDVRVKAMVNSPQGSFSFKWKPFGKITEGEFAGHGLYLFAGAAYRIKPQYNTTFTFRRPLALGEFNLTEEETGKVQVDVTTQSIQPFMGLGTELFFKRSKIGISLEAGMMHHGRPTVDMNSTGTLQLNDRNEAQIQQNISNMKFFPWMNFLIGYKL